jgi:hypothetical protein
MHPFNVAAYVVTWWAILLVSVVAGHPWLGFVAATLAGVVAGAVVGVGRPVPVVVPKRGIPRVLRRAA